MKDFFISILKIAAAAALLALAALCSGAGSPLPYAIIIPLLAAPAAVSVMRGITLAKRERLIRYSAKAPLFLLKSRTIPYALAAFASLLAAAAVPVRLRVFSLAETAALLPAPFVFLLAKYAAGKAAGYIYSENYAEYGSVRFSRLTAAFLMALIFPLITYAAGGVKSRDDLAVIFSDNPIAYAIAEIFRAGDSVTGAIFTALQGGPVPAYALVLAPVFFFGSGILFYFLINFFAFFFMKKSEVLSVFLPVDGSPARPSDRFVLPFMATLVLLFIYPALFAGTQSYLVSRPETAEKARKAAEISVELINGAAYKLGTWRKINIEKEKFYGRSKAELEKAADEAYDAMIAGTDKYLDWYYSLTAEYGRILRLLSGSLESYMEENLKKALTPENDNLTNALGSFERGAAELSSAVEKILGENRVEYKNGEYSVALDANMRDIYENSEISGTLALKKRLTASAGGGLAAGAVAGAVAGKIAAKTSFKTASKAVAKAAAQKAAGAAAGLAVGAVSGILTSPVGGIAAGTAVGLAIDKGMLTLEEMINRDEYKAEITDAINESRKETKAAIEEAFGE